jgi:molecular chaperone HtpG
MKKDFQLNRDKVQLYSRQVFITDDVKDVVPEFLQMLHGVIDSPDIPLNVSRSYLQADGNVKKINSHITKKVADKLQEIFRNDRTGFEEKWESVGVFVKYGIVSDDKFYDRAKEFVFLINVDGQHFTLDEYREKVQAIQTNKDESVVFLYASDKNQQDAFITSAKKREYDVLVMDSPLDSHFINTLESKLEKTTFKRVDSDSIDKLIDKGLNLESVLSEDEKKKVEELFKEVVGVNTIQLESLSPDEVPVSIVQPEFMRRWKDMQRISGQGDMFGSMPMPNNVVINSNHSLISKLLKTDDATNQKVLTKQLYDLGLLAQGMLIGADLTKFVERTVAAL